MQDTILTGTEQAFIAAARRAVLATIRPDGEPRLVPICFVLAEAADDLGRALIYSPLDDKPKASADPHDLGRVRDLLAAPSATVLVDRWSEDWARLGWIRLSGRAGLVEPGAHDGEEHASAVAMLRAKYAQYADHDLEGRPVIRIAIDRIERWAMCRAAPTTEHASMSGDELSGDELSGGRSARDACPGKPSGT